MVIHTILNSLRHFRKQKILISKWANDNLDKLSCENVGIYIRNDVIPDIYKTYLGECDSGDEPLSQECFLQMFNLKNVSNTTV